MWLEILVHLRLNSFSWYFNLGIKWFNLQLGFRSFFYSLITQLSGKTWCIKFSTLFFVPVIISLPSCFLKLFLSVSCRIMFFHFSTTSRLHSLKTVSLAWNSIWGLNADGWIPFTRWQHCHLKSQDMKWKDKSFLRVVMVGSNVRWHKLLTQWTRL